VSLLPPDATFEELVQDCFVAFRGCGLALSGVDAELLRSWAERGVPFEVVARGIRRRAERALWDAKPDEPLLRSLHACRAAVEREIRHYLARAAGGTTSNPSRAADPQRARIRQWRAALRTIVEARPELIDALSHLDRRVESGDALALCAIRALPFSERLDLLKQTRQALYLDPVGSAPARRLARRSARLAIFRKKFSLPHFW
jgi:hypothetical protein